MELKSYGENQKFIAGKGKGKIHIILVSSVEEMYRNSVCHVSCVNLPEKDNIEDINTLKAILKDKKMCKKCLRVFGCLFPSHKGLI